MSRNVGDALRAVGLGENGEAEAPPPPPRTPFQRRTHLSAKEQLKQARARAAAARSRARARLKHSRQPGPATGDFKPFNPGVGVALLLFIGVIAAIVMLAVSKRSGLHVVVNNFGDDETAGTVYAYGDLPAAAAHAHSPLREAASTRVDVRNAKAPAPRVIVDGSHSDAVISRDPAMVGRRILIVSGVQPPTETITQAIGRLSAIGVTVLGNYPGNPAGDEEIAHQLMLEAEAKMTRGLGQLDSRDTAESLSVWLADQDAADALVWFEMNTRRDAVRYHVYVPAAEPGDRKAESRSTSLRSGILEAITGPRPQRAQR